MSRAPLPLPADRPRIEAYKAHLQANRDSCTLFDTGLLVGRLEELYRGMCEEYRMGLMPQPDLVNLDAYFEAGLDHDHDGEEVLAISS